MPDFTNPNPKRWTAALVSALAWLATGLACAQAGPATTPSPADVPPAVPAPAVPGATTPPDIPAKGAVKPGSREVQPWPGADGMSAELFYKILLGNVALQRGEPQLAARAFYEAAKDAQDADLAARAAEIALRARSRDVAEAAANLWQKLEPSATRPAQILAQLASGAMPGGAEIGPDDVTDRLRSIIAQTMARAKADGKPNPGEIFLQLNRELTQHTDKLTTFRVVQSLAAPYPDVPEAQFALALAALDTGLASDSMTATAREAIERALAARPDWDRAALLKSEILSNASRASAIAWLESYTRAHPGAKPAWGALAQLYVEDRRPGDARTIFEQLAAANPGALEYRFGIGALSFQMKDWDRAEKIFTELKAAHYGEAGVTELYLAQIAEEQKRYDEAIARYREVPAGERGWVAELRIGVVMARKGDLAGAQKYLDGLDAATIDHKVELAQTRAQVLRDANDNAGAWAVLQQALAVHPDSPELLYDAAMVAEKLGRAEDSEKNLQRVVELKPDDAHALNALGYSLVDRSTRVDEGYRLIERALKLAPDDAFILDSMGWALFRLGRLDDSITYLQRALEGRPDPEIAAHLGEVLWAKGEKARAQDIWQAQLKSSPDNPVLLETVRRLAP